MSKLFDCLTNFIEISGNQNIDDAIIGVISIISFLTAFGVVGKVFELIGLYNSSIMSDLHWSIRMFVFAGLVSIATLIAKSIAFVCGLPWWVLMIIFTLVTSGTIFAVVHVKRKKHNNSQQNA